MKSVDLASLRAQFAGTRFCELIQYHLRRQSQSERLLAIQRTITLLPEAARGLAEEFVHRWAAKAEDPAFWERDTSDVFAEIIADARVVLRPLGLDQDDEAAFNLFEIVVMNYAYRAQAEPERRQLMGIPGGNSRWIGAVALLCAVGTAVYIAAAAPSGTGWWVRLSSGGLTVIGYGIATIGYGLLAAGASRGTVRIVGLNKPWQVYVAAVACLLFGTVLLTIGLRS